VNIEDQVAAMFARANPVPSLDLLDPIGPMDIDSLDYRSERSREMTEVKTIEPKAALRKRPWLVPVLATFAVIVVLVPVAMRAQLFDASRGTPSEQVAWAFVDALNAHDRQAVLDLYGPAATADGLDPAVVFESVEFVGAIGWAYENVECAEDPEPVADGTAVYCTMNIQSDWGRTLELEPLSGDILFVVDDGRIVRSSETWDDRGAADEAYDVFQAWIEENHPDDYDRMYDRDDTTLGEGGTRRLDSDAVALFEQYTDDFVADMGG
jgi:hypothetical protein